MSDGPAQRRRVPAYGAVVVTAGLALRYPITSVSATLDAITAHYGLSPAGVAILSSLPVLMFAAGAPLAPALERRFGSEWSALVISVVLLVAALAVRPADRAVLFVGTAVAGLAISGFSVLVPHLVRERLEAVSASGQASSRAASGERGSRRRPHPAAGPTHRDPCLSRWPRGPHQPSWSRGSRDRPSPPLQTDDHGPVPNRAEAAVAHRDAAPARRLLRMPGPPSSFALTAWLPTILVDRGLGEAHAARMLAWLSIASLPASLGAPVIAARLQRQHVLVLAVGRRQSPDSPAPRGRRRRSPRSSSRSSAWRRALRSGSLSRFIVLKAPADRPVASSSAIVQGFGYAIAALGPSPWACSGRLMRPGQRPSLSSSASTSSRPAPAGGPPGTSNPHHYRTPAPRGTRSPRPPAAGCRLALSRDGPVTGPHDRRPILGAGRPSTRHEGAPCRRHH